jgi:hypothetical protein
MFGERTVSEGLCQRMNVVVTILGSFRRLLCQKPWLIVVVLVVVIVVDDDAFASHRCIH